MVDIDIQQRGIKPVAVRAIHGALQVRAEACSIECAGEGIAVRELQDLVPRLFELNTVVEDAVYQLILQMPTHEVVLGAILPQLGTDFFGYFVQQQNNRCGGVVLLCQAQQILRLRAVSHNYGVDGRVQQGFQGAAHQVR